MEQILMCPECEETDAIKETDNLSLHNQCMVCGFQGDVSEFAVSEKVSALSAYLGVSPADLSEFDNDEFEVNNRREKRGKSPEHYIKLAQEIKGHLIAGGVDEQVAEKWENLLTHYKEGYESWILFAAEDQAVKAYNRHKGTVLELPSWDITSKQLENLRNVYPVETYVYKQLIGKLPADDDGTEPHRLANGLYFLLNGESIGYDWHIRAIRTAFNGEDLEDERETYETNSGAYLVLTDSEADERVSEAIEMSLWAFYSSFLAGETGLPEKAFTQLSKLCEDANEPVKAMIDSTCGFDSFVESAVGADGRGHFLSSYDGEENEQEIGGETFYIYRTQ